MYFLQAKVNKNNENGYNLVQANQSMLKLKVLSCLPGQMHKSAKVSLFVPTVKMPQVVWSRLATEYQRRLAEFVDGLEADLMNEVATLGNDNNQQ